MKYYVYKYVVNDEIIYIGLTNNIKRRVNEHASGEGIEAKFLPYLEDCIIYYHQCGNEVEMQSLEKILINIYKPILNIVDMQDGDSTIDIIIDWVEYKEEMADELDEIRTEIMWVQRNIQSNETRIQTYKIEREELVNKMNRLSDFYMYLDKHKDSLAMMFDECIGLSEEIVPSEPNIFVGAKMVRGWYESMKNESGICWVQFSPCFLEVFFSVSSQANWIDITMENIGRERVKEIEMKIENLTRKNGELRLKKEKLEQNLLADKMG